MVRFPAFLGQWQLIDHAIDKMNTLWTEKNISFNVDPINNHCVPVKVAS